MFSFIRRKPAPVPAVKKVRPVQFRPFTEHEKNWIMMRGYDAAKSSPFLAGWSPSPALSDEQVRAELPIVRQKARDLALNEPIVKRALKLIENNVIGPHGIRFSAVEVTSGEKRKLEAAWKEWAESTDCDAEGRRTLNDILNEAVKYWCRDGESIIEIVPNARNKWRFALRLRRADQLAETEVQPYTEYQNAIHNGVEVDGYGKPIAYHFYTQLSTTGLYTGVTKRVDASKIIHLYTPEQADIYRGFSWFAPVVALLRQLGAYREAELVAARAEAMRTGTWQATESAIDPSQVGDEDENEFSQVYQPGDSRVAPYGWEYKPDGSPAHPTSAYGTYCKTLLQTVASGLNLSYPTLASDLEGVSYSSIRAGTLEDREAYKCLQQKVISTVLRQIYRRRGGWLDCFFLSPACPFPQGKIDKFRLADYWTPRSWPWVDPQSDANARAIEVEHGWNTDSQVAASLGNDWYQNQEVKAEEAKILDKFNNPKETVEGE